MVKNSVIISVSVPKEQAEWLDMVEMSASEVIQEGILNKMELYDKYNQEKSKLIGNIENLQKEIGHLCEYLEVQSKYDEYRKWRGEKYG